MAEKMTAETATSFERGHSAHHMALLMQAARERGCECRAYVDWFTYARWAAQDMQVQKGEHGVKLGVFMQQEVKDENGEVIRRGSRPWVSTVFCRCQVKSK